MSTDRLNELFSRDGQVPGHLGPVRDVLVASGRERAIALWTRRSASARIIRDIVEERVALTHEGLDGSRPPQAVDAVRALLVEAGVLAPRDECVERFSRWASDWLAAVPEPHRRVLRAYARWSVASDLRMRSARLKDAVRAGQRGRAMVRTAFRFLRHLDEQSCTLRSANQGALDLYLVNHPGDDKWIAPFIRWARASRHTRRLTVPKFSFTMPGTILSDHEYHHVLDQLKTDHTLPPRLRLVGLLIGLYAQQVTAIAALPLDAVTYDEGRTLLRLGETPVVLPVLLASLVQAQVASPGPWGGVGTRRWLFPGAVPAEHISSRTLLGHLNGRGVAALPLRGAALLNLAAQLPLRPLCDLTGISPQVASRWQQIAGGGWNTYPSMRS